MRTTPWFAFARAFMLALVLVFTSLGCTSRAHSDEAADVAAFARLYGAVRYYYPGDAARKIDWNRFPIYGVQQVRSMKTPDELAGTLRELFAPVAAGVQVTDEKTPFAPLDAGAGQPQVALIHVGPDGGSIVEYSAYFSVLFGRTPPDAEKSFKGDNLESYRNIQKYEGVQTKPGRVAEFTLGHGLKARVPLSLPDAYARNGEDAKAAEQLRTRLEALPGATSTDTRVADVVVAWNVLRHFYPYWSEVGVDWDTRLLPLVGASLASTDAASHTAVLNKLVEAIRDGHGNVDTGMLNVGNAQLQVTVVAIGSGEYAVTTSAIPDYVAPGDVVRSVDGVDAATFFANAQAEFSGSPQWKAFRAASRFNQGVDGQTRSVRFAGAKGEYGIRLKYALIDPGTVDPIARRPAPVGEIEAGIWYVDLTRVKIDRIEPKLDDIAHAKAVIFDVRGYPLNGGMQLLPHLIDAPEQTRWLHTPIWTAPFEAPVGYESVGWDVSPRPPHIDAARYALMDGSAISFGESVLGYYSDLKLATIVGSASAGANGNIDVFNLPSGASIVFTGMKVTRHDGKGQRHLVGVLPDVKVEPISQSLREGRDIVLERALELARAAPARQPAP